MSRFVIFVCNYPREPHVAAATWPCIYLLSNCDVAAVQNLVTSNQHQSSNCHYRKPCDSSLSKDKPRKRIRTMFNVRDYELLLSKD